MKVLVIVLSIGFIVIFGTILLTPCKPFILDILAGLGIIAAISMAGRVA